MSITKNDLLQEFQNSLICVKLYETRMHDRLDLLRHLSLNGWKIPAFDVPNWLIDNNFLEQDISIVSLNDRGEEYLKLLETAEGDRPGSMYFNSTEAEKNMEGSMKGHPLFSECSLYEDVTHSTPSSKLSLYLNPTGRAFDARWVKYDGGTEYTRK